MIEIELGMSNFDLSIDEGFEEALREKPNEVFGRHCAWNFNGKVWFDGILFNEEIWVYKSPIKVIQASELQDLMNLANLEFGSD